MMQMKSLLAVLMALFLVATISGCSPEVGSEAWCKQMKEKPTGDWTANEAADFTQHCLFPKSE